MTPLLAVFRLAFSATARSHPLRALAVLLFLAAALSPCLVAFTFTGDDALAVSGAFGSAALLAPAAALFGGITLAAGDRGGDGIAPLLRGPSASAGVVAAVAAGISTAAIVSSAIAALGASAALSLSHREFSAFNCAGAIISAAASAPAAAAAGLLLAIAVPRALAAALACLLAAALLSAAGPSTEAGMLPGTPPASVFLLARDAAFGTLAPSAVALSCCASIAVAAGMVAAATALLRAKDLAPRPGDA